MTIKIRINRTNATWVAARYAASWVDERCKEIERHSRNMVRVRSGRTLGSINRGGVTATSRRVRGVVRSDSPIALIEDRGTPRHWIRRKRPNGPPLTFYWPKVGHWVQFNSVNHPGTAGSWFLTGAMVTVAKQHGMKAKVNTFR
jgi:hypothetical protein